MNTTNINTKKSIAFVVHADKKNDLIEWSYFNRHLLAGHEIIASGDAANILEGTLNKTVQTYITGPYNGYLELAEMITSGRVDALVLFGNAETAPLQANGLKTLIETALNANVIIALNTITADFILQSKLIDKKKQPNGRFYNLSAEQQDVQKKKLVA